MSEPECCKSKRVPTYVLPDIQVVRLLVTGGRVFSNVQYLNRVLDAAHAKYGFRILIHGGARGADLLADQWGRDNGVQPVRCDALWSYHARNGNTRAAGAVRNAAMLLLRPHLVLAFPGGAGTANMRNWAALGGTPLVDLTEDYEREVAA